MTVSRHTTQEFDKGFLLGDPDYKALVASCGYCHTILPGRQGLEELSLPHVPLTPIVAGILRKERICIGFDLNMPTYTLQAQSDQRVFLLTLVGFANGRKSPRLARCHPAVPNTPVSWPSGMVFVQHTSESVVDISIHFIKGTTSTNVP